MRIGQYLKVRRAIKDLSQTDVAEKAKIAQSELCLFENNERELKPERIKKIHNVLGGNLDYLFALSGRIPPDILDIIESMDEKNCLLIKTFEKMREEFNGRK